MASVNLASSSLGKAAGLARVARRLFSCPALRDWGFFTGGSRKFGLALRRQLYCVAYEVLEHDSTLELNDPKGEVAIYRKRISIG